MSWHQPVAREGATRSLSAKLRILVALAFVVALSLQGLVSPARADVLPGPTDGGRAIVVSSQTREIAGGITHSTYDRIDPEGTNHIDVLRVDLGATDVKYLDTGAVAGVDTLTQMARQGDVDAAVNGDFFDINNSGAVQGSGISNGKVVTTPNEGSRRAAVITDEGVGSIMTLLLDGTATVNGNVNIPVRGINMQAIPANTIAVYDSRWGSYTLTRPLVDTSHPSYAVRIGADGRVLTVGERISDQSVNIGEGEYVMLARGAQAVTDLQALALGDAVEIAIGVTENVDRIAMAVGGHGTNILSGGVALDRPGQNDAMIDGLHPRTAIGFGDEGRIMYLVTVDGRQPQSRGMSMPELGRLMLELGATEAMNLDGGGSTTMVVRDPGDEDRALVNSPSDGHERLDGNGVGVVSRASDGVLSGIRLEFAGLADRAERIFPGLQRTVVANPHDAGGRPVAAQIGSWVSSDEAVATVVGGVVTAVAPGTATITATSGGVTGSIEVTVLRELERIAATPNVVQLSTVGERAPLTVTGFDARGYSAPISPADISVEGSGSDMTLEPATDATFDVVSAVEKAGGMVTLKVGEAAVDVSYLIGRDTVLVTDFNDADISEFSIDGARSTQSIAMAEGEGRDGSDAVRVSVDFSTSPSTRTANFRAANDTHAKRHLEGQAVELRVTLKGDGVNTPMTYMLVDNHPGREVPIIYGPAIEATTDWQTVVIPVPQGFSGPFYFDRFALYETAASKLYETSVLIDSVELVMSPVAQAPAFVELQDWNAIAPAGASDESPARIAVMSDAQFVGRNPESSLVEGARRTLREIVATEPDAVYILGDFTDEANDEDFELARRIIDEELAPSNIPWTYVPGNHEIMGQPIANFIKHFGDNKTTKDVGSTRIITLDSSPYDLSFEQLRYLNEGLLAAGSDDSVTGVLVMFHHPTRDFLPNGASGLNDWREADMVEEWLSRFSETSGKHVSLLGAGVGAFHARQVDGVIHYTNGNSGKAATSNEGWGGWRGWTMLGVDPAKGDSASNEVTDWLTIETRPWVDEGSLAITAPTDVERGSSVVVEAGFKQDGIDIPVRWPVSASWGGEGVHVGDAASAPEGAVAAIDPQSRTLTFLDGAGTSVVLTLETNGATTQHEFSLPAAPDPGEEPSEEPGGDPSEEPGGDPSEEPGEQPSVEPTKRPSAKPTGKPTVPASGLNVPYEVPGIHEVNGRRWFTTCEPYSQTIRCTTDIWATQVTLQDGRFVSTTGWHFNNLTYLPYMEREQWASNPLGHAGEWVAADGRRWRTECDTAATGRGGCRSYVWADHVASQQQADGTWNHARTSDWVFNNIVRFR